NRSNVGVFVTILAQLSGLNTTVAQKEARNPLPSWFFVSKRETLTSGLRSLYDAEGSATSSGLQLSQVVAIEEIHTNVPLPPPKHGIRVSRLEPSAREEIVGYPPL